MHAQNILSSVRTHARTHAPPPPQQHKWNKDRGVQSACVHALCTHNAFYQACARTHAHPPTPIAFMANIAWSSRLTSPQRLLVRRLNRHRHRLLDQLPSQNVGYFFGPKRLVSPRLNDSRSFMTALGRRKQTNTEHKTPLSLSLSPPLSNANEYRRNAAAPVPVSLRHRQLSVTQNRFENNYMLIIWPKVMTINATFHPVHNSTFGRLLRMTHGNYANLPIYIYI